MVESIDLISVFDGLYTNRSRIWSASTKTATLLAKIGKYYQLSQRMSWLNDPEVFERKN